MLILDLWGVGFHAVVVFGLGKNLLFTSVLGHCDSPHFSDGAIEPDFRSLHTFKYHYRVVDIVACLFKAPIVPPKIETRDGKKGFEYQNKLWDNFWTN